MDYTNLLVEQDGNIVKLTINREKALNALNKTTMLELQDFFGSRLPAMKEVHGVILSGAGEKAFVAGADIKEFLQIDSKTGQEMAQRGQDIFALIENSAVPVIAVVNGFALGGGCELAMACHMRIASESARFGQPEVNLGIIPGYGGTQRLIQYIGKSKAVELLLTGDMINGEEAYRLGLVNYVLPAEEVMDKAAAILKKIAGKGPIAVREVIACVNAYFQAGEDGFKKEVESFGTTTGTEDFREGASAFIEKRKAAFKGK